MSIAATCATLAALLTSAQGGETINLASGSTCPMIKVTRTYPRQVTVNAGGSTIRGLDITGGGIRWRSGRIEAPAGAFAAGPNGYGIRIAGAERVVIDGVTVTAAKKGIVVMGDPRRGPSRAIQITRSRLWGVGEDGIIASRVVGFSVFANRFEATIGKPSQCVVSATITFDVAKRDCEARGGAWTDGFHADAVQLRDGVTDATIANNIVRGRTQGITQMDTPGDAPLVRVLVAGNDIRTDGYHRLTLAACEECRLQGNVVGREDGSTKMAVIIAGQAARCGNTVQDERVQDAPCVVTP